MSTYEHWDKLDSLDQTRTFILSILFAAILNENQEQTKEFSAKLAAIDNEIQTLLCTA